MDSSSAVKRQVSDKSRLRVAFATLKMAGIAQPRNPDRRFSGLFYCIACDTKGHLANRMQPCCVRCYVRVVIPTPQCRQPKPVNPDGKWHRRKGFPRRGRVRFALKVIPDDELWSTGEI